MGGTGGLKGRRVYDPHVRGQNARDPMGKGFSQKYEKDRGGRLPALDVALMKGCKGRNELGNLDNLATVFFQSGEKMLFYLLIQLLFDFFSSTQLKLNSLISHI